MCLKVEYVFVNTAFLDIHAAQWMRGSPESAFSQPYGAVITRSVADEVYKNENPIGKKLYIPESENQAPLQVYTIKGVIEDFPAANSYSPLEPLGIFIEERQFLPDNTSVQVVMLKTVNSKTKEINDWLKNNELLTIIPEGRGGVVFYPLLNNMEENSNGILSVLSYLFLSSLGFMVLLAGFITFSSIYVGTFFNRIRELSLRKSLGAGWAEPFKLLFSEMFLTVLAAFVVSLVCTELLVSVINVVLDSFIGFTISRSTLILHELQYFPFLILFCVVFSLFTSSRIRKIVIMDGVRVTGRHRFRNFMLAFQFFISFLFIGIGAIFHWQYKANQETVFSMLSKKEKEQIYAVNLDIPQLKGKEGIIRSKLGIFRGIVDILESNSALTSSAGLAYPETEEGVRTFAFMLDVSDNFSTFLHIDILQGDLPRNDQSAMVTKALYDKMAGDRTGSLVLDAMTYQVSGVLSDFINIPGNDSADEMIIRTVRDMRYLYVKCLPGYEEETREFIRQILDEWIPPAISYEIRTLHQEINDLQSSERLIRNTFLGLSLLLLFITFMGIYSSVTVDTVQRQTEVAIRKINGASMGDICWLFGRLYMKLLLIAALFAIPLLMIAGSYIMELMYRAPVNIYNPLFGLALITFLMGQVLIIISYRLVIISQMNPVEAIRSE